MEETSADRQGVLEGERLVEARLKRGEVRREAQGEAQGAQMRLRRPQLAEDIAAERLV